MTNSDLRPLAVVADDFGIGPATSRGIVRLCQLGAVTGTVLLVNSPYAEDAVRLWQRSGVNADLGWHPCLTLDAPVAMAKKVPSLVNTQGRFVSLGRMAARAVAGSLNGDHVKMEFAAQLRRFRELTGMWPAVVNSHHHVQVFAIVGDALRLAMREAGIRPFLRRVREPLATWRTIPGARIKRAFLSILGRFESRRQIADGFPGCEMLAGITDPPCVHHAEFFPRWLRQSPCESVELTCHPGHRDESILGRDAKPGDGNLERRVREYQWLGRPEFREAVRATGFCLVRPSEIANSPAGEFRKAG